MIRNVFQIALFISFFTNLYASKNQNGYDISEYFPVSKDQYWSFIGELKTDTIVTDLHIRKEIDGVTEFSGRETFRLKQKIVPSLSSALSEVALLNKNEFLSTDKGWKIYREEYSSDVFDYERVAKILPANAVFNKSNKYKIRFDPESELNGIVSYHTVLIGLEDIEINNGKYEALKIN